VGFFEEVTRDYGAVLERVNVKFGTGFSSFVHSEDNVKCVFDRKEEVHRTMHGGRLDEKVIAQPSAIKAGLKDALRRDLEAPEVRKLIARAEAVYDSFGPTEGHALQYPGATSSSTFSTISAWCSSQRHDAGDLNGQKLRIVPGSAPKTAESGRGSSRRHRPTLYVRPLHTSIL